MAAWKTNRMIGCHQCFHNALEKGSGISQHVIKPPWLRPAYLPTCSRPHQLSLICPPSTLSSSDCEDHPQAAVTTYQRQCTDINTVLNINSVPTSTVYRHQHCAKHQQCTDINTVLNINSVPTSTVYQHQQCTDVNNVPTSTMCRRQQCADVNNVPNINSVPTSTMCRRQQCTDVNNVPTSTMCRRQQCTDVNNVPNINSVPTSKL